MVAVYAPSRAVWPAAPCYGAGCPTASLQHAPGFEPFQYYSACDTETPTPQPPASHRWPWRGLAFCSDLGTVGYLLNRPKLGAIGWLMALPYYLYSIASQPDGAARRDEIVYQVTANGVFPFAGAKLGTVAGGAFYRKLARPLAEKYPGSELWKRSQPMYKLIVGLATLAAFTPLVGDPLSHWITGQYRNFVKEGQPV